MGSESHWLPGFNFNVEEWSDGDRYETPAICRTLEIRPRRLQGRGRREAQRPLHDPPPPPHRDAAPGRRLVSGDF
jgi:hypothetical protein